MGCGTTAYSATHSQRPKENEGTRTGLTLIFAATRHHVEFISALLDASGYGVTMIYGTWIRKA
jgi:ATP-dependent RNA helicase DDX54/DBP10